MTGTLHFIGVYHPAIRPDPRFDYMVRIFGSPDFVHRRWDARARDEVAPGDVAVFAEGGQCDAVEVNAYDDSAFQ